MGNQGRAEAGGGSVRVDLGRRSGTSRRCTSGRTGPGISQRFWWPQGGGRPAATEPVPEKLHWDVWLGPAPVRPYLGMYKEGKFQGKSGLSALRMARVVGLRHRHLGRHRLPRDERHLLRP